ncbi:putative hydroxymethylpyrimidine transporter CytX [Lachnospiraceae bacterium KH1T2]|nr:putative hydroxymethylpyrimidine transporter CytX [Lachnospiraceae bacterium KH1T2]
MKNASTSAEKKVSAGAGTSVKDNAVIWFGAGVSLAEILTGTYYADMGFGKGLIAVLLGHVIGAVMMVLAGIIGGVERKSSMETVRMSFGRHGASIFAAMNVVQLLGWTAIMTYDGALAANGIWSVGTAIWSLVIGTLIIVWILIGLENLGKISTVSVVLLFILSVILAVQIFGGHTISAVRETAEAMSFGAAVELAVAMPLSWLPLISDYTREAERPVQSTVASVASYSIVSIFMFIIGMGAAGLAGTGDISVIMVKAGLGIIGLLIIVLSTVTTTFLDAFSAGVSCEAIHEKIRGKWAAVAAAVIGTVMAMVFPMDNITDFLYFIGSVFTPMIAVQVADYFILHADHEDEKWNIRNLVIWLIGFAMYRYLMTLDIPVGNTLPDMLLTVLITAAAGIPSLQKKHAETV